jgi:hypothetical protein
MTIARPPGSEESLVQQFDGAVMPGSPLVVEDVETSVFVRDGQPIRVIGPGRYQVPPEFAGPGVSVYFVRTASLAVKFGGPIPPARPGGPRAVFGEVNVCATDPCAVATQLAPIGTGKPAMDWVRDHLKRAAAAAVAAHGAESDRLRQALPEHTGELARFGVTVVGVTAMNAR